MPRQKHVDQVGLSSSEPFILCARGDLKAPQPPDLEKQKISPYLQQGRYFRW